MREWLARRREEWFRANGPCVDCGSRTDLQLDHIDAATKVSHKIWSWRKDRRLAELAKCVVRCGPCHLIKTVHNHERARGERNGMAVLSDEQVREIRRRHEAGERQVDLARMFGASKQTVWDLVHGHTR